MPSPKGSNCHGHQECDTMLNYLSQQEVAEYFCRKKTSYFFMIQVMDNFCSIESTIFVTGAEPVIIGTT